ncbi:MAG: hypothetical protein IT369_08810 [Candidatus Latescibacteria bacterium]|nr:hypothetical protein [Candidatus Latescibacterota bacterium]
MTKAVLRFAILLATLWATIVRGQYAPLRATVIDRLGNQHQVSKLSYRGNFELEYFVGDQPRTAQLVDIARFRLDGERGDEEQPISITWRNGATETGRIFTGGAGISTSEDALGSGQISNLLSGVTDLGPISIQLSDVREVIFRHADSLAPGKELKLKATIIDLQGRRFEVSKLRYRGQLRLDFTQGRKQRSIDLAKIAKIEFPEEGASGTEFRPIVLTFWSGKALEGTVDASTVRLGGETDRIYQLRVGAAFTGDMAGGPFAIGLQDLKLVRFYPEEQGAIPATEVVAPDTLKQ